MYVSRPNGTNGFQDKISFTQPGKQESTVRIMYVRTNIITILILLNAPGALHFAEGGGRYLEHKE